MGLNQEENKKRNKKFLPHKIDFLKIFFFSQQWLIILVKYQPYISTVSFIMQTAASFHIYFTFKPRTAFFSSFLVKYWNKTKIRHREFLVILFIFSASNEVLFKVSYPRSPILVMRVEQSSYWYPAISTFSFTFCYFHWKLVVTCFSFIHKVRLYHIPEVFSITNIFKIYFAKEPTSSFSLKICEFVSLIFEIQPVFFSAVFLAIHFSDLRSLVSSQRNKALWGNFESVIKPFKAFFYFKFLSIKIFKICIIDK